MLSYQHAFHAGNLADLHKHGALAWMLEYLTRKDKPLSYIETHAGRGVYNLASEAARKTGEAEQGILAHSDWFAADHPLSKARKAVQDRYGTDRYPGSPAIAAALLRASDQLHLAELHPGEHAALTSYLSDKAHVVKQDGFELAHAVCPPTPRRGLVLIDPPYEIKDDYADIPRHIAQLHRAWNVGIIALWYPILTQGAHGPMLDALSGAHAGALRHEVRFPPARPGHGMVGSGLFVLNPPFGLDGELKRLARLFSQL